MASSSNKGSSCGVMIISPNYCSSTALEFIMVKKILKVNSGNFEVENREGKMVFKVNDPIFHVHDTRVLLDSAGVPVVTLQKKIRSLHSRWQVFRGNSTEECDLLFRAKRMIQISTVLEVYLPCNTKERFCDFKLEEDDAKGSYTVFVGESDQTIAKINKKGGYRSMLLGKSKYAVSVSPDIDYAFIISLILIAEDCNSLVKLGKTVKTIVLL